MKKRLLSLLIALTLVLSLIPLGAVEAKAASEFKASEELIEMIKYWEGFSSKPYWDYGQWTVGYGTRAPSEHLQRYQTEGISREEATELLDTFLVSMGRSVNSFIDKFGLTVNQQQFDAMLSFTYNCGSGWMLAPSTLRTSMIEAWTGDDLVFAMGEWSNAGGVFLSGLVRRRQCEANLYLNGVYSTTVPESYSYVTFDANGGEATVGVQAYINTEPVDIRATATNEGCEFEGWYTDPTGGEKVEKLDASLNGYALYAHWRAGEGEGNPQETPAETITGTPVNYTKQVVSATLNVFQQPVKGALVVDALAQYDLVDIVAEYTDSTGVKWGKVNNVGWINLSYVEEPVDDSQLEGITVKVTGTDVNIRRGPGTAYASVGTATLGQEIVIVRTSVGGGYTWGKFSKGWIALKYTNYDDVVNESIGGGNTDTDNSGNTDDNKDNNTDGSNGNNNNTGNTETVKKIMGTVNADYLYVRSGAGVTNAVVGGLSRNARVEILEQKSVSGTIWGRTDKGWISLKYVTLDNKDDLQSGENTEQPSEQNKPEQEQKPESTAVTGKVKLTSGCLNIRTGPSTGYGIAGYYQNGASVTILEQKTVGTMNWGRTDKGWISLDYVKLDEVKEPEKAPEQTPEQNQPEQTPEQNQPEQTPEQNQPEQTPEQTPEQDKPVENTAESGTVSLTSGCLRIRSGAGINNAIVGNLYNGAKVTITERKTVNGTQWGKMDKGWICLDYVKFDTAGNTGNTGNTGNNNNTGNTDNNNSGNTGSSDETPQQPLTGKVNVNDYLCIRNGAGTNYTVVGYYVKGNQVTITEQKNVGGTKWGRTNKGWISLDYVILDGESQDDTAGDSADSNTISGTVTGTGLRIRSGAGTNNRIVGSLTIGDKVTILETATVDGTKWGRIEKGWICMDYVKTN